MGNQQLRQPASLVAVSHCHHLLHGTLDWISYNTLPSQKQLSIILTNLSLFLSILTAIFQVNLG